MKKLIAILILLLCSGYIHAQSSALDSLIKLGISLHDDGKYEKAIEVYKKALKISPDDPVLNYELSFSYMALEDYDNSIEYADKVIGSKKADKDTRMQAIITKGSALDYMGKQDESIELFEKCLKDYGPYYLLYFNLGVDYLNTKEYNKAETAFINAIKLKRDHPGSNFYLCYTDKFLNKKCQSLMAAYYFLLLEPSTERSKTAYNLINKLHGSFFKKNNNGNGTTIFIDPDMDKNEGSIIDFTYSMHKLVDIKLLDSTKTKSEIFALNAENFFNFLSSLKEDKKLPGIWKEIYIPFFTDLVKSGYINVYCQYISLTADNTVADWFSLHKDRAKEFSNWLREREMDN
ncbi:MAG: tetratricopeptide repeat protein [Bacteroidetes bacterium]|nr:tetratricopeptide repeat protein [Bacteroidota bacterium]